MEFNVKMNNFLNTKGFLTIPKYMVNSDKAIATFGHYEDETVGSLWKKLPKYLDVLPHKEFVLINPHNDNGVLIIKEYTDGIKITCVECKKNSFGIQDYHLNLNEKPYSTGYKKYMINESKEIHTDFMIFIMVYLYGFLDILNNKEYRTGIKDTKLSIRNKYGLKSSVSRNITYISNIKYLKQRSFNTGDGIVWEHGWPVRGFWRRIGSDRLGLNRKGDRDSLGRTWVRPGVRNRHLPQKNNIRIIR